MTDTGSDEGVCVLADVDLSVVAAAAGSRLDNSAALHRRAVKPRRQRPVTQFHSQAANNDELFQVSLHSSTRKQRASTWHHRFIMISAFINQCI